MVICPNQFSAKEKSGSHRRLTYFSGNLSSSSLANLCTSVALLNDCTSCFEDSTFTPICWQSFCSICMIVVNSCSESIPTCKSKCERRSDCRAIRPWLIKTKIVRNTLSEETNIASTPKGYGSKGLTPGITRKFHKHQTRIKLNCVNRNPTLPTNPAIRSLTRSVALRRLSASCSNFAIASMLYCVGLAATGPGNGLPISDLLKKCSSPLFSLRPQPKGRGEVFRSKH